MAKIRLIRTMIMEYEPNPDYYPKGSSIEDIAKFDIEGMKDSGDYESMFNDNLITDEVIYEIIA